MSELHRRVADASAQVVSRWSPERAEAAWRRLEARQRSVARVRAVGAGAAVVLAVLVIVSWPASPPESAPPVATTPRLDTTTPRFVLDDGTEVVGLTGDARISELERSPDRTRLRLEQGAARFRVTHRKDRVFEVVAADIRTTVLGTVFTLRLEPDTVVLSVEAGSVRLRWSEGDVVVVAGERRVVPRRSSEPEPEQLEPATSAEPPRPTSAPSVSAPSWRELAQHAEYAAAYESLTQTGPSAVRDEPGDLLLAADVTRLGGHPGEAVTWLRRVVDGHAGDSRAPLAAFTLGRIYLDQLGSPAQAAAAFAQARRMAPGGALAEDALAREVEARARSGDASGARSLAERYLERYPNGRRAASVRRRGGLETTPTP